ncbi:UV radiation resistance-associated gene protein p63 [Takifugu flavidus]|uniref:UV radiation resistance-associated gene protein p63 n=1 Tax=Takifugu flavidus TaxID=433684 RepID=A0A5C6P3F9_9TELE|nr:UV radiation resistance-associated gene protein p63 [Takifugu flavidus]
MNSNIGRVLAIPAASVTNSATSSSRALHVDLASQQRRLRHLRSIAARNILNKNGSPLLDTFFTLHLCVGDCISRDFYKSEVIRDSLPAKLESTNQLSEDLPSRIVDPCEAGKASKVKNESPSSSRQSARKPKDHLSANCSSAEAWRGNGTRTRSTGGNQQLQQRKTSLLERPSQSPDLNPAEVLGHGLQRAIHTRHPSNTVELKHFGTEEWSESPPDRCAGLSCIYRRRLVEVPAAKGGRPVVTRRGSHTFPASTGTFPCSHLCSLFCWQNPTWRSLDFGMLPDLLDTSASCFVVRIWGGQEEQYTLLLEWKVNLDGLRYTGQQIRSRNPNEIIFGLNDGYYAADFDQKDQLVQRKNGSLQVDQSSVRNSYSVFSLLR